MSKITRYDGNLQAFGINSVGAERTVFGDAGTQSNDITDNVTTEYLRGWGNIPTGGKPTKQDFNGVLFAATQMIAYLHQMGTPEWNISQEYHVGSRSVGSDGRPYRSLTSPNSGNDPVSDDGTNWINDTDGLQDNIDSEAATRLANDNSHAALTYAHSATATPTGSRIAMYNASSQLSTATATDGSHAVNLAAFSIIVGPGYGKVTLPLSGSPNDIILQWKEIALPNKTSVSHTFHYPYANACAGVFICRSSSLTSYLEEAGTAYYNLTTTGCTIDSSMPTNAMIYAIGY